MNTAITVAISDSKSKTTNLELQQRPDLWNHLYRTGVAAHGPLVRQAFTLAGADQQLAQAAKRDLENWECVENGQQPMWLPPIAGELGQLVWAASLWERHCPATTRQCQRLQREVPKGLIQGSTALARGRIALKAFGDRIDQILRPGHPHFSHSGPTASTYFPDFSRQVQLRAPPPLRATPDQIRTFQMRDPLVHAAIDFLQLEAVEKRSAARYARMIREQEEQLERIEHAHREGRPPYEERGAAWERYSVAATQELFQRSIEEASGELERGDVERGDHSGRLSQSHLGRRILTIHHPPNPEERLQVTLHVGARDNKWALTALMGGKPIKLPADLEETPRTGLTIQTDAQGNHRYGGTDLLQQLERLFGVINPRAKVMDVKLKGGLWDHVPKVRVHNLDRFDKLGVLSLRVTGDARKMEGDWIQATINDKPIDVTNLVTGLALGSLYDKNVDKRRELGQCLNRIRLRHAPGCRALLVWVRGKLPVPKGDGRTSVQFVNLKMAVYDPVPIKKWVTVNLPPNEAGTTRQIQVEKTLACTLPFEGNWASVHPTVRAAQAWWDGRMDNVLRDWNADRPLFDFGPLQTKLDAVKDVFRFMYYHVPKTIDFLNEDPTTDEVQRLVPPEHWDTFRYNLDALWDEEKGEAYLDSDPSDLHRVRVYEPYVAMDPETGNHVTIEADIDREHAVTA